MMRSPQGQVSGIQVSDGGVPKRSLSQGEVTWDGLLGDRQRNLKYHGGRDRALCLWSLEVITTLQREGHPISPGSTGENLTLAGLDWGVLLPGARLQIGAEVEVEITDYAAPCRTIAHCFLQRKYGRISQKQYPGMSRLYGRVLHLGRVELGDAVWLTALGE